MSTIPAGRFNVVYRAAGSEQPVLSGGRTIAGFVADASGIYNAPVDASIKSRHLYVEGEGLSKLTSPASEQSARG